MSRSTPAHPFTLLIAALCLPLASASLARDGGDRDRSAEKAAESAARAEARAARDSARDREVREIDQARTTEQTVRRESDSTKDSARITQEAAKEAANGNKASEDTAKAQADAVEETAKEAEDAAKDAADAAERAAKDAADAAEDAAKAAEDAAEEAAEAGTDSSSMRDLASDQKPEYDNRGFPAKRGEIVGLDMSTQARAAARANGLTFLGEQRLPAVDANITRLGVPKGMAAKDALDLMRKSDAQGSYDLTHYYGLNIGTSGGLAHGRPVIVPRRAGKLRVGMIDTSVTSHPALRGTRVENRSFVEGKASVPTSHGTAIASLLAGQGSSSILAAGVFSAGNAAPFTSADAIARALDWMVAQKVNVINISLAGPRNSILDAVLGKALRSGHVIVAAAGNGGPGAAPAYPAAVPGVVAVTAVDPTLRIYRYANQGHYVRLSALGVGIEAAGPNGSMTGHSGTSFATPLIAARIARCLAGAGGKAATCIQFVERSARDLGAPGKDPVYGFGYVAY